MLTFLFFVCLLMMRLRFISIDIAREWLRIMFTLRPDVFCVDTIDSSLIVPSSTPSYYLTWYFLLLPFLSLDDLYLSLSFYITAKVDIKLCSNTT